MSHATTGGESDREDEDPRLGLLHADVRQLIKRFDLKRQREKLVAFTTQTLAVVLGATVTVLLGLRVDDTAVELLLKNVALGLSATITVIGAMDAFFHHRERWVRRTITLGQLYDLRRDLQFYAVSLNGDAPSPATLDGFRQRLSQVMQDDLQSWLKLRSAVRTTSSSNASGEVVKPAS